MAYTNTDLVAAELGGFTLGSTTTPSTDDVDQWIKEAKAEIDARTGQTFEPVTVTQEIYDYDGNDDFILRLKNSPIVSITTLQYNAEAAGLSPSWTTKTEDTHFYTYADEGEVEFIPSAFAPTRGKRRFRITYKKGQSSVPLTVKQLATMIVARRLIRSVINSQASVAGGRVSVGTITVDDPSMFTPAHYKSLGVDIDEKFSQLMGGFKTFRPSREYL